MCWIISKSNLFYSIISRHCDGRDIRNNSSKEIGACLHNPMKTIAADNWSWWRHSREAFSALLALCDGNPPVTGEFLAQRPVMRRFDVFFDLRLNKQLNNQWRRPWFETPSRPLWRHCNVHEMDKPLYAELFQNLIYIFDNFPTLRWHRYPKYFLKGDRVLFPEPMENQCYHYSDAIMSAMATQITRPTFVYSVVYSGADQRRHQSSASLAFVQKIHRWPVNSPHKEPVTRKMFPF